MDTTIFDVARRAKVSKSTVSLVVNGSTAVKESTREKVLKAIREIGYVPNRAAREMVTAKTGNIGLWIILDEQYSEEPYSFSNLIDSFSHEVSLGVENFIQNRRYGLLFSRTSGKVGVQYLPPMIKEHWIDGLIVIGGSYDERLIPIIEQTNLPSVLVATEVESSIISSIYANNQEGISKAVDYLVELGHHRIAMLNTHKISRNSKVKLKGYLNALERHQLVMRQEWIRESNFTGQSGFEQTLELFKTNPLPTAIVCSHDVIALGAMRAIRERGLRVPEDISLIGFEDDWLASYADPPLTTIRINKKQLGELAARRIFEYFDSNVTDATKTALSTQLIVRSSCASLK